MSSDPSPRASDLPVLDEDTGTFYSIEVIAELAGVETTTVLRYQEQGFLRPVSRDPANAGLFDAEGLRQLRRIEHLRTTCEVNDAGLKLILSLLQEVERLREERRQRLR